MKIHVYPYNDFVIPFILGVILLFAICIFKYVRWIRKFSYAQRRTLRKNWYSWKIIPAAWEMIREGLFHKRILKKNLLLGFIAPALHKEELRSTTKVVVWSYVLFMAGIIMNYLIIFPLAFRFLGTYQVSADIPNIITLESYTNLLVTLTFLMGIFFQLPILAWFLGKLGIVNSEFMKKYRRHAIVAILIIAAIITPTTDVFTLTIVSLPIYLLYELSILIVRRTGSNDSLPASFGRGS
jgi:Tat protein translocase TatC